jgi:hypothetical protein
MNTTHTIRTRAAIGTTVAAILLAVGACGTEQGAHPTRENRPSQHSAADDVAAQVEHRKTELSQEQAHRQHSVADDVERWVELLKSGRTAR